MTYENQGPVLAQHQAIFELGDTQDLKTSTESEASQVDFDVLAVSQIALLLQSVSARSLAAAR